MFKWFKRYRRYHVVYVYVKKGDTSPTIADQMIISDKRVDDSLIHDLKVLAKSNYDCDSVAILNIIKL